MEDAVTSESPTPQPQHWTVMRYLRLLGTDLACARCGTRYHSAKPAGYGIGESPCHCPRCQLELTSPAPSWTESLPGIVVHAVLLLGACVAIGMVMP